MIPSPTATASIQDFMRFSVGGTEFELHATSSDYVNVYGSIACDLAAEAGILIASEERHLDRCTGSLSITTEKDLAAEWAGSILRQRPYRSDAGFTATEYTVMLKLSSERFRAVLSTFSAGFELFGLLLDFQNVTEPEDDLHHETWWDDLTYPHVAMSGFLLRWKRPGSSPGSLYSWPG